MVTSYEAMVLLVTTYKTQNCNSDRKFSRVKFLILPRRLAGGKNITEESLCFSSYIGSYAKMSQPTVLGVGEGSKEFCFVYYFFPQNLTL